MSSLTVYPFGNPDQPSKLLTHAEDIARTLAEFEVGFEQRETRSSIVAGADDAELVQAYREEIAALREKQGLAGVTFLSVDRHLQDAAERRAALCVEARLDGRQVCFFAAGSATLGLHLGEQVLLVGCQRGDLLRLPASIPHWLDIGQTPHLALIRLFDGEAALPQPTGSDLAAAFLGLDD